MANIVNFKVFNSKVDIRNIILSGMLVTSFVTLPGCTPDAQCDIKTPHAHLYTNDDSLDKYMLGEKVSYGNWERDESYIKTDDEMQKLIEYETKQGLYRISLNKDKIDEIVKGHEDVIEYRYKYEYLQPIPHIMSTGKVTTTFFTYLPMTGYSWTTDENHNDLTGETRIIHYVYTGYRVEKTEDGNFKTIESEPVDSLNDLDDDYIYVKGVFYKKVYLDNKEIEADYEDGPEEDKRLNEEQQKDYEKQLSK